MRFWSKGFLFGAVHIFLGAMAAAAPPTLPRLCSADGRYCENAHGYQQVDNAGNVIDPASTAAAPATTRGAITDGSGTIAASNQPQQVFATLPARSYVSCQNPASTSESLSYRFGSTGGWKMLAPGADFTFLIGFIPTTPLFVQGATVSHPFTCWQG